MESDDERRGRHRGRPERQGLRDNFYGAMIPLAVGATATLRGASEIASGQLFGIVWVCVGVPLLVITAIALRRV